MRRRTKERLYIRVVIPLICAGIGVPITFFLLGQPEMVQKLGGHRGVLAFVSGIMVLTSIGLIAAPPLFKKLRERQLHQFTPGIKYEAEIVRIKPEFDSETVFQSLMMGGVFGVLAIGLGYLFFSLFVPEIKDGGDISLLDVVCYGLFLFPVVFFLGWASFSAVKKGVVTIMQRREWLKGARKMEAVIVGRQAEKVVDSEGDMRSGSQTPSYELILKIGGQLFQAVVSERIFRKYVKRDSVNVFYAVGSPEVFVVEGE